MKLNDQVLEAIRLPHRLMGIEVYLRADFDDIRLDARWKGTDPNTGEAQECAFTETFGADMLRIWWDMGKGNGPESAARCVERECREIVVRCVSVAWDSWASVLTDDSNPRRKLSPADILTMKRGERPRDEPEWVLTRTGKPGPSDRAWEALKRKPNR